MSLPPFNCVILGEQSASLINYVNANPGAPKEISDLAGRLDYYQRHPWEFVPVPIPPQPGTPPPSTIPAYSWPLDTQPPLAWGENRRSGDNGAAFLDPRKISVYPIVIPADAANGQLGFSVAEYRTGPTIRQASISRTPGDFVTCLSIQKGSRVTPSVEVGRDVMPGETVYGNTVFWDEDNNVPSTGTEPQGVTVGGPYPK